MFNNLTNVKSIYMYYMFGSVSNFSYAFNNCYNLENFTYDINYDSSHYIRDTRGMFYNCHSLKAFSFNNLYIYISSSDSNYYINMSSMFYNCHNLEYIIPSNQVFRYIKDLRRMFFNCSSLTSVDLTKFQTNSNHYVNLSYMFYNCKELTYARLYSSLHVSDMHEMFFNCKLLNEVYISNFNGLSSYVNMSRLFYGCELLGSLGDFNNFKISDAREMFFNCNSLEEIFFKPYFVIDKINMSRMFYNCTNLTKIHFYLSYYSHCSDCYYYYYFKPSDLHAIFYNCINLTNFDISRLSTVYIQDMSYMFYNCKIITNINSLNRDYPIAKNMRGMFQNCESIINLNLNNFYSELLETTWDMFKGCSNLKSLYLNNFKTIKVTDMESMFEGCSSLISLNLNSFNTKNVRYMNKMFKDCVSLETLYLKNITAESLGTMHQMFYNCKSLKYLNLFYLIEIAQTITEMFTEASQDFIFCIKEEENIPNIFKLMTKMENISRDCTDQCYGSGKSRFPIQDKKTCCPDYEYKGYCYKKCPSKTEPINRHQCGFLNCSGNLYNYEQNACLNTTISPEGFYINDTESKTIDKCDESCKICNNKTTDLSTNCLLCNNSQHYLYLGNCLESCEKGFYNDSEGILRCECFKKECKECLEEDFDEGLCISCADDYHPKIEEYNPNDDSVYCYKDPEGYYLDNGLYKSCFQSCQSCDELGNEQNHLCTSCSPSYGFVVQKDDRHLNCYVTCAYFYYFDDNNTYHCTFEPRCHQYPYIYLLNGTKECIKNCENTLNNHYIFQKTCFSECPPSTKESQEEPKRCKVVCPFERPFEIIELEICVETCSIMERREKYCVTNYEGNRTNGDLQDLIQTDIVDEIIKSFNYSQLSDTDSIIIEENGTTYEIISTKNTKVSSKTSTLKLGSCENKLKDYYGIQKDDALYIFKIDANIEGKTGPTVEYKVFYPFPGSKNLDALDLTLCEGNAVSLSFSMNLTNPELYDKNSRYYNDICYSLKSNGNVDIILDDRKQEYAETNKSLCEENCEYIGYDQKTSEVQCSCEVKINLPLVSEIKIDKNKLYNFMNIKKIANFDFLNCYNLLLSKEGIATNIGFYLFIPTFIVYFICIIWFYKKEYKPIKDSINNIIYAKQNLKYVIMKKKKKPKTEKKTSNSILNIKTRFVEPLFLTFERAKYKNYLSKSKNNFINNTTKINRRDLINKINAQKTIIEEDISKENDSEENEDKSKAKIINDDKNIINSFNKKKINSKMKANPPQKNRIKPIIIKSEGNNNSDKKYNQKKFLNNRMITLNDKRKFNNNKLTNQEKERILSIMKYNDGELNDLEYKLALTYDKRTYFEYYWSLLKTNHLLFKIFNKKDYNSMIIKIYLCLFNFDLNYSVNALFFNDDTMHKIYEDGGDFNFIYQLPQIIYSTIIAFIFGFILDYFALSEKSIIELKHEKLASAVERKGKILLRTLQFKFINFFIISFIFFACFWYYLSCFCAVYRNTQYHLIKDTLISYGTSMITPIGYYLIPGIFRIPALKKRKSALYTFSKIFHIL